MVNRINTILQAKNITAKQFAEEIGVQPSGVSHILSGRNNPSLDFVMKVVRRYPEININWLMFGNGEMWVGNVAPQMAVHSASSVTGAIDQGAPFSGEEVAPIARESVVHTPAGATHNNMEKGLSSASVLSVADTSRESGVMSHQAPSSANQIAVASKANNLAHDNLTLFDDPEPTLFTAQNEKQDLEHSRALEPVGTPPSGLSRLSDVEVKEPKSSPDASMDEKSAPVAKPAENCSNGFDNASVPNQAILGNRGKKILKIVVLYDDHSFTEFSPA